MVANGLKTTASFKVVYQTPLVQKMMSLRQAGPGAIYALTPFTSIMSIW